MAHASASAVACCPMVHLAAPPAKHGLRCGLKHRSHLVLLVRAFACDWFILRARQDINSITSYSAVRRCHGRLGRPGRGLAAVPGGAALLYCLLARFCVNESLVIEQFGTLLPRSPTALAARRRACCGPRWRSSCGALGRWRAACWRWNPNGSSSRGHCKERCASL